MLWDEAIESLENESQIPKSYYLKLLKDDRNAYAHDEMDEAKRAELMRTGSCRHHGRRRLRAGASGDSLSFLMDTR
jgi:hypothetical protein